MAIISLAEAGRATVERDFTWTAITERLARLYGDLWREAPHALAATIGAQERGTLSAASVAGAGRSNQTGADTIGIKGERLG